MTARPQAVARRAPGLRVIGGTAPRFRPRLSPFVFFSLVVVLAMFAMVVVRTTLDRGAVELSSLATRIEAEQARVEELNLRLAGLENATRIGPLAEQMGMVYPDDRLVLVVDGVVPAQGEVVDAGQDLAMEAAP
jgi:cell division protein FtsL